MLSREGPVGINTMMQFSYIYKVKDARIECIIQLTATDPDTVNDNGNKFVIIRLWTLD